MNEHRSKPVATKIDSVSTEAFVNAMGASATGVSIVTTQGTAGRFGITVSALASVSAEPPLLLVCLNRKNPSVEGITQNGAFAVSVLAENQSDLARSFSGRPVSGEPYEFVADAWRSGVLDQTVAQGSAAVFTCVVDSTHDAGTHRIFIGRVVEAERGIDPPLIYSSRAFGRAAPFDGDGA
jgi:flavin reductase (DIM6/NTAB) family NADH-FMN oxidoreductase RutF